MRREDVRIVGSEVRDWARRNGHDVRDRGRIAEPVLEAYRDSIVQAFRERTAAERFSARGAKLWRDLHAGRVFDPTREILAEEACRIADRLEKLDRILTGERRTWVRLGEDLDERFNNDGEHVVKIELVVDGLLGEARHQQGQLRALVLSLGVDAAVAQQEGTLSDFVTRRDARIAEANRAAAAGKSAT